MKPQCRPQPVDLQAPPRCTASLGGYARALWAALGPPESPAQRRDRQPHEKPDSGFSLFTWQVFLCCHPPGPTASSPHLGISPKAVQPESSLWLCYLFMRRRKNCNGSTASSCFPDLGSGRPGPTFCCHHSDGGGGGWREAGWKVVLVPRIGTNMQCFGKLCRSPVKMGFIHKSLMAELPVVSVCMCSDVAFPWKLQRGKTTQ